MVYAASPFRDFESYRKITGDLNEDQFQLNLKHYFSKKVRYEIPPEICSIRDISEMMYTKTDRVGALKLEYDDKNMQTTLILKGLSEFLKFYDLLRSPLLIQY